jgi:uncharacterized protein (TIGR00296 family)
MLISDPEGAFLVSLARKAVTMFLHDSTVIDAPQGSAQKAGVFITLNYLTRKTEEHLRGCIGFPLPYKSLTESVIEAAIAAATADPRFPPVDLAELPRIIFEMSILTEPTEIDGDRDSIRDSIRIGRDGLILRWKDGSGLLLPQVPLEMNWTVDEFLANVCYKAGAGIDALSDPSSRLYVFQAVVFKESEPLGTVIRLHF